MVVKQVIGEKLDLCANNKHSNIPSFFLATVSIDLSGLICTQYLFLAKSVGNRRSKTLGMKLINHLLSKFPQSISFALRQGKKEY